MSAINYYVTGGKHRLHYYYGGYTPLLMHSCYNLKALCHDISRNSFLMSSLVQLKWVQEVWACPVLQYSVREFAEIEHVQHEDFVEVEWRSS